MSRKLAGVLAIVVAAVCLIGCGIEAAPRAARQEPVSASRTAKSFRVALSLPSGKLQAGSAEVATVTLTNFSDAATDVPDSHRVTITGSKGNVVYESVPSAQVLKVSIHRVWIGANASVSRAHNFDVPAPGVYRMYVTPLWGNYATPPPTVAFVSVK